jgi:hypothetical protein
MESLSADTNRIKTLTAKILAIRTGQPPPTIVLPHDGSTMRITTEAAVQSFVSAVQERIIPHLFLHFTRALTQCFSAVVDLFAPYRVFPRSLGLPAASQLFTHPYLLQSLRRFMHSPNATFFNTAQVDTTQLCTTERNTLLTYQRRVSCSTVLLLVLAETTLGTRKTTPGMLNACLLDQGQSTLWPVLLSSMHLQLERICKENGATCESWNYDSRANNPPNIILVTIEKTVDPQFHEYVVELVNADLLACIIVDEAHLAAAHAFRDIMHTLTWAASQGVQLVLQTATMLPSIEALIFKAFGVMAYSVVRASTTRPNISYNVIRVADDDEMYARCESLIADILVTPGHGSVLIFCKSRTVAEEFGRRNNIPFCHVKLTKPEIDVILAQLHARNIRVVVTTTLLGVSLNEASITDVIHLDYPFDALGYIQESGRSGQAPSTLGWSYVIIVDGTQEGRMEVVTLSHASGWTPSGVQVNSWYCIRSPPGVHLDSLKVVALYIIKESC